MTCDLFYSIKGRWVSAKCRVWMFECSCRAIMRMRSKAATAGQCLRGRTSVFLLKGSWPFDICVSSYLNDFHVHAGITCIALHRASFPLAVYLVHHWAHTTPIWLQCCIWRFCDAFVCTPWTRQNVQMQNQLHNDWLILVHVIVRDAWLLARGLTFITRVIWLRLLMAWCMDFYILWFSSRNSAMRLHL